MKEEEWRVLAKSVSHDVEMLTRASSTQSEIQDVLKQRQKVKTEEQIIDADAFGGKPGKPRIISIGGIKIKVWKIHRLGLDLSDVKGADLYYELGNRKFVLVQYKIPNSSNRVVLDDDQLRELKKACPVHCLPTKRFCCGSWYALHKKPEAMYFPACEAMELFGTYASRKAEYFVNGLTQAQFLDDFGSCNIGARTKPVRAAEYRNFSKMNDHVVIRVKNLDPAHMV